MDRLVSLDVFRGATIASMILVNNPGSWGAVYAPLRHAVWHGWTFTDLVFPFFLWIAGVAMTLSFAKRLERGDTRSSLALHTLRRAALIFAIGLLTGLVPRFDFATMRIPGVLQRIAVCYAIAGLIYLFTALRGQVIAVALLLASYWALMMLVPVPGFGAGQLDQEGNFARYVDGILLSGHMYSQTKTWDPEGVVSTLPAIATTLFGILAGRLLRSDKSAAEKTVWLFVSGNALLVTGLLLDPWLPINKNLWTSSYALFTAGMASNGFALFYWVIDIQGRRRWVKPFAIYGMNAITVYVLSGLLAKAATQVEFRAIDGFPATVRSFLFDYVLTAFANPQNASLLYALLNVLLLYLVAWWMYRRKWFIKL